MRSHESSKFDDINIVSNRHPQLQQLEAAFLNAKPLNTLHFIKKWAQKQMKEVADSDEDEEAQVPHEEQKKKDARAKQERTREYLIKRRPAVVMAKTDQNDHWRQFMLKEPLLKNEQCRSRIMLSLRQIPFLQKLGWDDINYLVDIAQVREYYRDEIFVNRGQFINRLYILVNGQIKRTDQTGNSIFYGQGKCIFIQSLVSLFKTNHVYTVTSQSAWICGIQSYSIYELQQSVNRREEDLYEKIIMGIGLFACLDPEEMYKLICMVKKYPPFKPEDIVVEKDTPISKLFLVLKGEFLLCKKNISGQITSFLTYREGQFFGEEWLTKEKESEYAVIARTQGVLGYIEKSQLEAGISDISRLLLRRKQKRNIYK